MPDTITTGALTDMVGSGAHIPEPEAEAPPRTRRAARSAPIEADVVAAQSNTDETTDDTQADGGPQRFTGTLRDVADLLPGRARERLTHLRMVRDAAIDESDAYRLQLSTLTTKRFETEREARRLVAIYGEGRTHELRKKADSEIATFRSEEERLRKELEMRPLRAGSLRELVRRIERWIVNLPSDACIRDMPDIVVEARRGETIVDAVERCRRRLRELDADARRVRAAPVPAAIVKDRARAQVAALANKGEPDVSPAVEVGEAIRFGSELVPVFVEGPAGGASGGLRLDLSSELVAWLFKEQLITKLDALIDEVADDENALDDDERAERLAEIERDRQATEFEEARLIERAAAAGIPIPHRSEMDVRAVLGVRVEDRVHEN